MAFKDFIEFENTVSEVSKYVNNDEFEAWITNNNPYSLYNYLDKKGVIEEPLKNLSRNYKAIF